MLGGEVALGDTVRIGWDATAEQVRIEPEAKAAGAGTEAGTGAGKDEPAAG